MTQMDCSAAAPPRFSAATRTPLVVSRQLVRFDVPLMIGVSLLPLQIALIVAGFALLVLFARRRTPAERST